MPSFSPYTIHHLQLDGLDSVTLPAAHHYLVIWQGRIPLGHCWLELDKGPASLVDYRETMVAAIRPALEYYRTASPGHPVAADPIPHPPTASASPAGLSVIICTRNRPKDLERCVRTLLDAEDKDFELIVVDNASDDDQTAQILKNFPSVRYVKEDRKGLDIARNTGARAASHPLLAYTDDDVQVDRDWTRHIKTSFEDPLVMAVTGLVIPELLKTRSQYIFER
jgi:hypothetical protein